jgi:hypothetical protein
VILMLRRTILFVLKILGLLGPLEGPPLEILVSCLLSAMVQLSMCCLLLLVLL